MFVCKAVAIPGLDLRRGFSRRLDVDGVPARAQPPGDAGPVRSTRGASALELMHTMTRSGISAGSSPSRCRRDGRLVADLVGDGAQRQLAQGGQVGFAEEVRERLLDLLRSIDLALPQPRPQAPRR
jgi:hypothetical protein